MNKFDELFQDHLPNIEKTSPLRQGEKEIYFHCFDNEIYYLSEILKYHNVPFVVYDEDHVPNGVPQYIMCGNKKMYEDFFCVKTKALREDLEKALTEIPMLIESYSYDPDENPGHNPGENFC